MEEQDRREIGYELRTVHNLIRRTLDQRFTEEGLEELSGMQGPMIGFIYDKSQVGDVFQKDIEKEFNIRRSTATVMLQNMETKGLILRQGVDHDGRLKRIVLTEKARACHRIVRSQIEKFHRELEAGITREEKKQFLRTLDIITNNLNRELQS